MNATRARRRASARTAAAALGLLGLAGCGSHATRAGLKPSYAPQAPAAPMTAPPPAPARPGLLINQAAPFTERSVRRLRHLGGVEQVALIGYGQIRLYGDQIPTASVDPATYRSFTPADTRDSTPVWKAVMDGKALVSHLVGERDHLPLDAVVPAGWATVRIAGLATTVPGVDMVVNGPTGERIGVPFGNGLIVAVKGDPGPVTTRIRGELGQGATIRRIAATGGPPGAPSAPLLPSVTPTAPPAAAPGAPAAPAAPTPAAPAHTGAPAVPGAPAALMVKRLSIRRPISPVAPPARHG